jgi:lipid II:glycine glycyltransferase (peptidoglycan interpeptide bridge formation enzyme)
MKRTHPLQSTLWGKFREKTGVKAVEKDGLLVTIHKIPKTNFTIGYLPKGPDITQKMLDTLYEIGRKENCIFIQIEPNAERKDGKEYKFKNLYRSARPLFTKYTFILDLTKTEEELLRDMHPKTRYNLRLAEKKGVRISEDNSDKAFADYLNLTKETTERQKFYAHSSEYHRLMWETLKTTKNADGKELSAHLLKAVYNGETLVTWIVFILGDTLYYPYGASSSKHKEVMASNLMMWETIKFGKKLNLKYLDMWGALGKTPDPKDPWYGFHRFKEGYGGRHVEFVGSYDFVINKKLYYPYVYLNQLRWFILRFK